MPCIMMRWDLWTHINKICPRSGKDSNTFVFKNHLHHTMDEDFDKIQIVIYASASKNYADIFLWLFAMI